MAPPHISAPVPSSRRQFFVVSSATPWTTPPTAPCSTICPDPNQLSAPAVWRPVCSTGSCRLACSAARKSLVCWGWIVLHAISSLVHWCCSCPGQGRAANPWWLWWPGSIDFRAHPGTVTAPIVAALHLTCATAPQHSPLPVSLSNTFLGLCQPQDPLNRPTCNR